MHGHAASEALPLSSPPNSRALPAGQLARQATGGDLDSFEQLIHHLERRVYGFAYQHLRDASEAHDLTQEIFVKLYRNLGRYDDQRPFEPWFWKLAANTTINYRRRRVPTPAEWVGEFDQPAADRADPTASPDRPAHDPALVQALTQLDPAYRLPILLHYYADLTLEQVSQTLNLSVAAVKSRLHRARAQLRNALAEDEEFMDSSS